MWTWTFTCAWVWNPEVGGGLLCVLGLCFQLECEVYLADTTWGFSAHVHALLFLSSQPPRVTPFIAPHLRRPWTHLAGIHHPLLARVSFLSTSSEKLFERKAMWDLDSVLKNSAITLLTKVPIVKAMHSVGISFPFSSSHVRMWEVNHREGWVLKNWCFWTVVLERTLEIPLDCKEIKPVNPKGNQPWIFTGRTDVQAEAPLLWLPDAKSQLIGKTLMLGKIEGRKGQQRMKWLDIITNLKDTSLNKLWEITKDRKALHAAVHGVTNSWTQLIN